MQPADAHRYIDLKGFGTVHYVVAGQGPPLVLLHGLGASVVVWHYNIPALSRRYAVYAPDLPGHGDSARPNRKYDLESGVAFLLSFLDTLGPSQEVTLVGSSLGGLLCLAAALRTPQRFPALVLVAPVGLGRAIAWQIRVAATPVVGKLLFYLDALRPRAFLGRIVRHPERIDSAVHEELLRVRKVPGTLRTELRIIQSGVSAGGLRPSFTLLQDGPSRFPVPTLLVWGEEDKILPVALARKTAQRMPETPALILPDCGHLPQMEAPEVFNQAVLAFLEREHNRREEFAAK